MARNTTRFTRLSQLEEEWADIISIVVVQGEGRLDVPFPSLAVAREARNRFYHFRTLLRRDPRYAVESAQAEMIVAKNPTPSADGSGAYVITFLDRSKDAISSALRAAIGDRSHRRADTPLVPIPKTDDDLTASMFNDDDSPEND